MSVATSSAEQQVLPGLWEALQQSPRNRPASRPLNSFQTVLEVCMSDAGNSGSSSNKYDLLCPRQECGSVILKTGRAKWVERASVQVSDGLLIFFCEYLPCPQMEPIGLPAHSLLPTLQAPPEMAQWWLITPSPMAFENIGFTRPVNAFTEGSSIPFRACGSLFWYSTRVKMMARK